MPTKDMAVLRPCANCPFRKDVRPFLRTERAREVATSMPRNLVFHCHKTTDETGDGTHKMCAGAVILARKQGLLYHNQMARIVERLGANLDDVQEGSTPVYDTPEQMVAAYRKVNGSRTKLRKRV